MSRTYNHTPIWVVESKSKVIDHDHRDGVCNADEPVVDWGVNCNHYRKCNKRVTYNVECVHIYKMGVTVTSARNPVGNGIHYVWRDEVKVTHCSHTHKVTDKNGNPVDHPPVEVGICGDEEDERTWYDPLRRRFDTPFEVVDHQFARHTYQVTVRDNTIECKCDEPGFRRSFDKCMPTVPHYELRRHYGNAWYDYDEDRIPRSRVKNALAGYTRIYNGSDDADVEPSEVPDGDIIDNPTSDRF